MKKAFIIATGTELLLGNTIDTNSVFIAQRLAESGIKVIGRIIVGDQEDKIYSAFALGAELADIIISSGGLGPTKDDLTKEMACNFMQVEMTVVDEEVVKLKEFFNRRQKSMPESNIKQAMFPSEAIILTNKLGTAPGMYLFKDQKTIILLPGPPKEMKKMFIDEVEPLLQKKLKPGKKALIKTIKVFGPGESQVEEIMTEVMENPQGCSLALLAVDGEIHIRITAEGQDSEASKKILTNLTEKIEEKLGANIYGYDDDTLTAIVAELINKRGLTLAIAESCTGGYLAKTITDLPGSSSYFWGAAITYSNEAKNKLIDVDTNTISTYGAVSKETALEMAQGIKKLSGSSIGIALTGIAGPEGGTETKQAGLVYIALVSDNSEKVKELKFTGDREGIRILAVKTALDIVRKSILSY